jgi:peroxiredoxin
MKRTWRATLAAAVCAVWMVGCAQAADLKIGDAGPDFKGIIGTDDKQHALDDYKDAKAVVVAFICNHCPVAVAYEDRLVKLQADYKDKGVQLIAVNVNTLPADRLDKMKERAEAKGFNFPYLYDETQKIGRDFGAKVTPHVFVLDKDRKLAYVGAIDNSQNADKAEKHYLRDALDAIVEGKTPDEPVTRQFGCGIKYND